MEEEYKVGVKGNRVSTLKQAILCTIFMTQSFPLLYSEVQAASVSGTPDLPCSGYMRELHSFTARMHSQHLSLYHCTGEVQEQ